jgi:outer membrane protein, heavy metal efflux system
MPRLTACLSEAFMSMKSCGPARVVLLVLGCAVAAIGAESDEDSILAGLLSRAAEANPEVVAARERAEAARARVSQATAQPDPTLMVGYTNDGLSPSLGRREMTTLGVTVRQPLTRPRVRQLRGEMASADAERAGLQLSRAELSVAAAVRRAYAALGQVRAGLAVVHEQEPLWQQIEESARGRYEVGLGSQADWIRARIERVRLRQSLAELEADAEAQSAELGRLTGDSGAPSLPAAPLALHAVERTLDDLLAEGEPRSPELRAASTGEERARSARELARAAAGVDLAVDAGYMNRGGLDPMWQVGVEVTLPLRRGRLRAMNAEATAEARAAGGDRAAVKARLRQRTAERLARLRALERVAALYRDEILPQGQLAVASARAAYEAGGVPLYSVIEAIAAVGRDRLVYLEQLARHEQVRASLFEWSLDADAEMASAGLRPMAGPAMAPLGGMPAPRASEPAAPTDSKGGM